MQIIKTDSEPDYVRDYYEFVCQKLSDVSSKNRYSVIGLDQFDMIQSHALFNKAFAEKIFINYEHNLVHPAVPYYPIFGNIPVKGEENLRYLVRIEQPNRLVNSDFYLEYSMPNIENMKSCVQLSPLLNKVIYFPPILCEYSPESDKRSENNLLTSFYILNPEGRPRRKMLHDRLKSEINGYINIPMSFGQDLYDNYYKKSKVMVNVHQTDHHHTFEELRVLPALLNGMVVVAEDSPLKEKVPYHEYIIWAKYEEIVDVAKDAIERYDFHYDRIHGPQSKLRSIIESMNEQLDRDLLNAFSKK